MTRVDGINNYTRALVFIGEGGSSPSWRSIGVGESLFGNISLSHYGFYGKYEIVYLLCDLGGKTDILVNVEYEWGKTGGYTTEVGQPQICWVAPMDDYYYGEKLNPGVGPKCEDVAFTNSGGTFLASGRLNNSTTMGYMSRLVGVGFTIKSSENDEHGSLCGGFTVKRLWITK